MGDRGREEAFPAGCLAVSVSESEMGVRIAGVSGNENEDVDVPSAFYLERTCNCFPRGASGIPIGTMLGPSRHREGVFPNHDSSIIRIA